MSHNQSRAERSESTQYRKTARSGSSNQQRQFTGGVSTKGGGGASAAPNNPSNRSFKKYNSNSQVGQPGARSPNVDSTIPSAPRAVQNGAHEQQPTHGIPDSPVGSNSSNVKPMDATTQKFTRDVPKAPPSNVSSAALPSSVSIASSESKPPSTPGKAPGDASKSFPLQFGSISPGFMNGMQIPARTSSAPPNLDEQKKAQARHESLRSGPAMPIPSIPKQQLPKKDAGSLEQPNAGDAQLASKSKRDAQVSAAPPAAQAQKPSIHPIPGMTMQLPFHQPQVPVQFGGPNPQIQSQAMPGTSLPMPMPMSLPLGNPPVQHSMFVPGLQPHPLQSQGMMHQGQTLNFSPQMGPIPPQLGNMGINMAPQFPPQPAVKYSGSRKTVKITHPETHEELRLESSPASRSHPNMPSQSQPIPSFPPNIPMNFYPSSYNAPSLFFPAASSVPLSSSQVPPTSQPPRFYNQVTVKPPSRGEKEQSPSTGSLSVGKEESSKPSRLRAEDSVRLNKDVDSSSLSSLPQTKPVLAKSYAFATSSGPANVQKDEPVTLASAVSPKDDSASVSTTSADEARTGAVPPDSIEDNHKNLGNRGQHDQVVRLSATVSSLPSQLAEAEDVEAKSASSGINMVSETAKESSAMVADSCEASHLTIGGAMEEKTGDESESLGTKGVNSRQSEPETVGSKEQGEATLSESLKSYQPILETSFRSLSLESQEITGNHEEGSDMEVTSTNGCLLEDPQEKPEESSGLISDEVEMNDDLAASTHTLGCQNTESSGSVTGLSEQNEKTSPDVLSSVPNGIDTRETTVAKHALMDQESAPVSVPSPPKAALGPGNEDTDSSSCVLLPPSLSNVKDKALSDTNVARNAMPRVKKKKKELYKKAEAAGTSSDLYMAYKGPVENKETVTSGDGSEKSSIISEKQTFANLSQDNAVPYEKPAQGKVEPDDWEDVVEISSPQLETSKNENDDKDGDGYELTTKRYSRDFLLKFVEQCTDLPDGFEITADIADTLMVSSAHVSRQSYPSPGRTIDRPIGGSRPDRRGSGLGDEDKWSKFPGSLMSGRGDIRTDLGYASNIAGFRPGQGGNYGVLRNPRAQAPMPYAGGILSGPMQSLGPHGGLQRNNSDSDRWQRGTGFQKGLMPSPQTPMPVMHKAEKKYEVGRVADEEDAKQRQLKAILNKLTPQNFEKLFQQVKQLNIDNVVTLSRLISQIFDKALMEPTFCEMYANFCFHLAADLPDLSVENEKITFKRLLLNKCQEEFERGEREEEEANKAEEEGEAKQTAEEREEKRLQARRRMLGNIRLIGELYKKRMLTERIMHECLNKLLGQYQNPDEENIEALCKLMSTIGEMIDHPKAKEHIDAYFDIMAQLSNNMKLSSRVRFMLKDAIDLRKNKWQQRRKVEGPKKIEEVHRDAAQERQTQASRLGRAPSMASSVRRGPPMDFGPRSPGMLSPPGSQIGGFRAVPPQLRGYGSQDVRMDERHSFENRTMSVPLPQRPLGDDSITLGPQGGLAKGMAYRGQPSAPSVPLAEMPSPGDARRMGPGPNGFSSMSERAAYGQREDLMPRYMPDRFAAPPNYNHSHSQERKMSHGNREVRNTDNSFDSSMHISPPARGGPTTSRQNVSSDKVWSEEHLRDKSVAAIREFYSARDENEVALCIKDLNSPSFYPSMISIWVTDSFERKDVERDLLTKLLINLTKPRHGMISEDQLIKGFESVLAVLEDAVNDAPRAAEFLGRIFAKVVMENVISLSEIGRLIYEGGEEQGQLVEIGLAAEVLGSVLDIIKSEKGDSVLNEICSSSNLRLENFRPAGSNKSLRIDKFI
ncbi:eukaryotic translation initiation factor 4G-like [Sesamum indicum]|uniref:Eukaryotic translation initiation factor 4G n=1 Tax=Sesamum indicum TaxID=4182 RepID=A0A6I9TJY5_SESIN|nr:eukaryotic translation initiation factor 4G-like [Sesamum indicum]